MKTELELEGAVLLAIAETELVPVLETTESELEDVLKTVTEALEVVATEVLARLDKELLSDEYVIVAPGVCVMMMVDSGADELLKEELAEERIGELDMLETTEEPEDEEVVGATKVELETFVEAAMVMVLVYVEMYDET